MNIMTSLNKIFGTRRDSADQTSTIEVLNDNIEPLPFSDAEFRLSDADFRNPTSLAVTITTPRRVLVIGSCFAEALSSYATQAFPGAECDFLLYNFAGQLPERLPHPIADYDFIVIMLPLRTVMPETAYIRLSADDAEGLKRAFDQSKATLNQMLEGALEYTRESSKTTFVLNYLEPQDRYMGRLMSRRDLRNPAYYCRLLNDEMEDIVSREPSAFWVDLNDIANSIGSRMIKDDFLYTSSHGSFVTDWDAQVDQDRIEKVVPVRQQREFIAYARLYTEIWSEILASFRIVNQVDAIKLVVTDLDDTLWRGVALDSDIDPERMLEGWPLGYIEALLILKRRGILLGIASKNERDYIERVWPKICRGAIELSDFAAVKIGWVAKVESMEEMLRDLNLLPGSVLFIDDNPVEREAMKAAFPTMRVIGGNPYELRHLLLCAPELQVPVITDESSRRTEMVQAQVAREETRRALPREEFLATLGVRVSVRELTTPDDGQFQRAFELLNKTNQFNTTGKRWTREELLSAMSTGMKIFVFECQDRLTAYGLIGVVLVRDATFEQFVMSCRVVGLDAEIAALSMIARAVDRAVLTAVTVETSSNLLSRDLWRRAGFYQDGDVWRVAMTDIANAPPHIAITNEPSS